MSTFVKVANDYRKPNRSKVPQIIYISVGEPVASGNTLLSASKTTIGDHYYYSYDGAAIIDEQLQATSFEQKIAWEFLRNAVVLTGAMSAIDESLSYVISDVVKIYVEVKGSYSKAFMDGMYSFANKWENLAKYGQIWRPEELSIEFVVDTSEEAAPRAKLGLDADTYLVGSNGGKDSTLSSMLLDSIGFKPYKIDLHKFHTGMTDGNFSKGGVIHHIVYPNDESLNFFGKLADSSVEYLISTREKVAYDKQGSLLLMYYIPYFNYLFDKGKEPKYLALGTEWGCSTEWYTDDGKLVPNLPFEDGKVLSELFHVIADETGIATNTEMVSPIAGLYEVGIVNLLIKMGSKWGIDDSCWNKETIFYSSGSSIKACETCLKCLRNKLILSKLDSSDGRSMLDSRPESILKTSPSMFTYCIASNDCYRYLRGLEPKEGSRVNRLDYANIMYTSEAIKQLIGKDIYTAIEATIVSYGFQVVPEPEVDFDLDLVLVSEVYDTALNIYDGIDHWKSLPEMTKEEDESVKFVTDFTLPYESEVFMLSRPIYPMFTYYNVWVFYDKLDQPVKVKIKSPNNPYFKHDEDKEVPIFTNPIVKNSLRWGEDKIECLEYLRSAGLIESYEYAN